MTTAALLKQRLLDTPAGAASKAWLAPLLGAGMLRLPLRSGSVVEVHEADPHFEAKALLALTVLRASFQDGPAPLDEAQASAALGLPDAKLGLSALPAGFYLLAPTTPPQIAAAYLPEIAATGQDPTPFAAFQAMLAGLGEHGFAAPHAMACRVRLDPEALLAARDPLADHMSIGAGLGEQDRLVERAASKDTALERLGISLWTQLPSGAMAFGYPAAVALVGPASGVAHPKAAHQRALICMDCSVEARAAQMAQLPILNHDAASEINNTRDIEDILARAGQRRAIVASMADTMLSRQALLNGGRDDFLPFARAGADADELRRDTANNELKRFGKERKLFVAQGASAFHSSADGQSHLVVSLDMALVDGQHSSRDYALIAMGCELALRSAGPQYWGAPIPDCSPRSLSAIAFERARARFEERGDDPLGLGFADIAAARVSHDRARAESLEKAAEAACYKSFAAFVPTIPVGVSVSATSDPQMARLYAVIENTQREQSIEAKAMAAGFSEVQELVAEFNAAAARRGDPTRIAAIKSLHASPDFSTAQHPGQLTREFVDLYPYLKAVSDSAKTAASRRKSPDDPKALANAARWEALAILADEGHIVVRPDQDEVFLQLAARVEVLLSSLKGLKGRPFELEKSRLPQTIKAILSPEQVGPTLIAFTKVAIHFAKRLLSQKVAPVDKDRLPILAAEDPVDKSDRVYSMVKASMELKDALRHETRGADETFKAIMSESTLDNVMLSMLLERYALDPQRHPASSAAVADLAAAKERLVWSAAHAPVVFNKARTNLQSLVESDAAMPHAWPRFPAKGPLDAAQINRAMEDSLLMGMGDKAQRRLIVDSVPGPGLGLPLIERLAAGRVGAPIKNRHRPQVQPHASCDAPARPAKGS